MTKNTLLGLNPIKKFINGVGKEIVGYFGKDKGCIIGLEDDGVFYAEGLYNWLIQKNKNITFFVMDDYGKGFKEELVKGRKVLLLDNDIVTGKAYRLVMDFMRERKEKLKIKDIKFAVLCDRMKMADFSVEDYPMPTSWNLKDLDKIDLEIIGTLSKNGRKSFVEISEEIGLTPVGIKKRFEKLVEKDVLKVQGFLNIEKFYSISAHIHVETDSKTTSKLIKKFEKCPLVYSLVKAAGNYYIKLDLVAPSLKRIEDIIEKQISAESGVKRIEVDLGAVPAVPLVHSPAIFGDKSKKCPCETKCNECEYFL